MVEALGVVRILFQLGCVSASGLTLVVLLNVPPGYRLWTHSTIRYHKQNHQSEPLDSLWWFCLWYRLWIHVGGFV